MFLATAKPWGVFSGAEKAPAGSTRTHTLVLGKDRSRTRPLQGEPSLHPQDQVPREGVQSASAVLRGNPYHQSSPGLEPSASRVRCPCANPLGNLATVGHLAKASPDLSPHFRTQNPHFLTPFTHKSHISDLFNTQKPHFLTSFQQRKSQFSDT